MEVFRMTGSDQKLIEIKGGSTAQCSRLRMSAHQSGYLIQQNYGMGLGIDSVIYEKKFKDHLSREQKVINTIRFFADVMEDTGEFIFKLHHGKPSDKRSNPNPNVEGIDTKLLKFLVRKLADKAFGGKPCLANLKREIKVSQKLVANQLKNAKQNLTDAKMKIKAYDQNVNSLSKRLNKAINDPHTLRLSLAKSRSLGKVA